MHQVLPYHPLFHTVVNYAHLNCDLAFSFIKVLIFVSNLFPRIVNTTVNSNNILAFLNDENNLLSLSQLIYRKYFLNVYFPRRNKSLARRLIINTYHQNIFLSCNPCFKSRCPTSNETCIRLTSALSGLARFWPRQRSLLFYLPNLDISLSRC